METKIIKEQVRLSNARNKISNFNQTQETKTPYSSSRTNIATSSSKMKLESYFFSVFKNNKKHTYER